MISRQANSLLFRVTAAIAVAAITAFGTFNLALQSAGASAPSAGNITPFATLPNPTDGYYAMTGDPSGNLYVVDSNTCDVIKIDFGTGLPSTIASGSWCGPSYEIYNMTYAVVSGTPKLIIADYGNSSIWEVPAAGGSVMKVGTEYGPAGVAYDSVNGTLFITDWDNNANNLWQIPSFASCNFNNLCAATQITTTGLGDMQGLLLNNGTIWSLAYNEPGLLASVPASGGAWSNGYDAVGTDRDFGNLAVDPQGNIYYLGYNGGNVMVLPSGGATASPLTLTGSPSLYRPSGGPIYRNGSLYVVNHDSTTGDASIVKIALPGAPAAPTNVAATAGDSSATVSWTASSGATSYTVTANPGGATCTVAAPATSCTVTGLTNGTPYTFTVTASSSAGTSDPSLASTAVTPMAANKEASLAKTGAPLSASLLLALGVLGLGTFLVARRRRLNT